MTSEPSMARDGTSLSPAERGLLCRVDGELAKGLALARWWQQVEESDRERFEIIVEEYGHGVARGFSQQATIPSLGTLSLTGAVQTIPFIRPKARPGHEGEVARLTAQQIREFALHYFLRITDFAEPQIYPDLGQSELPLYLRIFSWHPPEGIERAGIGLRQIYFKRRDGRFGKFPAGERFTIVDLREIGPIYDWVLLEAVVFDASLNLTFYGPKSPNLVLPLRRRVFLALRAELTADEEQPCAGILGSFGPGFIYLAADAFRHEGFLPAFETVRFRVAEDGNVEVRMVFICREPHAGLPFSLNPLDWWSRLANLLPPEGAAGREPRCEPSSEPTFDPLAIYVDFAELLHGGRAEVSLAELNRRFLFQHCLEQRRLVLGSLQTWNQIPDWLDAAEIPAWVRTGHVGAEVP